MQIFRIVLAMIFAAGATMFMVSLEEYAGNMFRNTLRLWFGPAGEPVSFAMAIVYTGAVFAFMLTVVYTIIYVLERGFSE